MRTEWDIERYRHSGRIIQVLSQHQMPEADIYAVFPEHHQHSTGVKVFVDLPVRSLGKKSWFGQLAGAFP